jgi:hypothetical protein
MAFDTADARMVRAWAATLSETSDLDVPTIVVWLGLGGTIDFGRQPAPLEPAPGGTSSVAFTADGKLFLALHVTFGVTIERADFERLMGSAVTGNPATYRYQMPGGPFSTAVFARYDGSKLVSVDMRREAPIER